MADQKLTLENGVQITFKEFGHKYIVENEKLIGVSAILDMLNKPSLVDWKIREKVKDLKFEMVKYLSDDKIQKIIDDAESKGNLKQTKILSTGKLVHGFIEKFVKDEDFIKPEDPVVLDCLNKFITWWTEKGFTLIASEKIVCLPGGFAGTIDLIAKDKEGRVWLIDIKTNNGIFVSHVHQLHGYKYAYEKQTGQKIDRMCIVRLPKDGSKIEVRRVLSKNQHLKAFLGLLSAYKSVKLFEDQTKKYNQKIKKGHNVRSKK